jgi:hypothetical protein
MRELVIAAANPESRGISQNFGLRISHRGFGIAQ